MVRTVCIVITTDRCRDVSSCRVHATNNADYRRFSMTIQELERVIAQEGRNIYSFCLHLTGSRLLADELYQETFLRATEKMNTLHSDGNLKSYLLSVALMLWKNQKRKFAWRSRKAARNEN